MTSSCRRPMKRLMEKTVFSGFVIAWRLATCPTRISPSLVKATTDGVSRLPSWLGMTVGFPPSITATTEFVVPRSMPITFAMSFASFRAPALPAQSSWGRHRRGPSRPPPKCLQNVDLDLARLELLRLGQRDLQHAVAVARLHLVGLHRHRQLHQPLELAVHTLRVQVLAVLGLVVPAALALDREQVAGNGYRHVLLAHAGQLDVQHQVILGLVHVDGRQPRTSARPRHGTAEERVEQPVHLALDVADIAERLPTICGPERTPTLHRHS